MAEPYETIEKTFKGKTIGMDAKHFSRCRFENCQMVYNGGIPPVMQDCSFANCSWAFGENAANTLGFLSGFYTGGFADLVENTFHGIRKGDFLELPLPPDQAAETKPSAVPPMHPHPLAKRVPRLFKLPKR